MILLVRNRIVPLIALATVIAAVVALIRPTLSEALPDYTAKTGQACATCHVNPAGGGTLTDKGKAFQAIPTHVTDPVGAWNQASGAPAPAATPAPAPAPSSDIAVSLSGASTDDAVIYSIVVSNSSDKAISNLYVAGSIPAGATFSSAISTPGGGAFFSSDGGEAAWLVNSVAAKGSVGPFVYKVAKGTARDLSVSAFVHWLSPTEGTAGSATATPLSNAEGLAVDQAIKDKFSKYDAQLPLWRIQPGTAPRMMELTEHFNQMWFAAQAGNWVFADFEIYRSDETLKAIPVTRAARAAGLKAWWDPAFAELRAAARAGDLAAFEQAYDRAIAGCNSCHVASTGGGFSLAGVKVVRPTTPVFSNLDFKGN